MKQHISLEKIALKVLKRRFMLTKLDLGKDARFKKKGTEFLIDSYRIEDVGRLSILRLKTVFSVVQMESVILTPNQKDAPLLNIDWVKAFGRETMICELYDVQLEPYPEKNLLAFQKIVDRDVDLPAPEEDEFASHWYDDILYPCSYHKKAKKESLRLSDASIDYMKIFARQLEAAPVCDREEKQKKIRTFAETLFAFGGPAIDTLTSNFGQVAARRIVVNHLYGCPKSYDF